MNTISTILLTGPRGPLDGKLNSDPSYGPGFGPFVWVRQSGGYPCQPRIVSPERVTHETGLDLPLLPDCLLTVHSPTGESWTRWPSRIYWRGRPARELPADSADLVPAFEGPDA